MTSLLDFQDKCDSTLFLKPALAVMGETPERGLPPFQAEGPSEFPLRGTKLEWNALLEYPILILSPIFPPRAPLTL